MTNRAAPESALAWLDLDESGRAQMQEKLALLNEPDTLDELGVGQIRDAFSDALHPGTSTLWRRARYMLFVPWVYQELERDGTGNRTGTDAARLRQVRLIRALKAGGDTDGLIGARTDEPQRLPDELLWNGLRVWGIRRRDGSLAKYRRSLEAGDVTQFAISRGDFDEVLDAGTGSWWHQRLPSAPPDLYSEETFELLRDEAQFLREQLSDRASSSLLHVLSADPPVVSAADFPWEEPEAARRLEPAMRKVLDHGRVFSQAFQGAGLLYSYHVAIARNAGNTEDLGDRLADWSETLVESGTTAELRKWPSRAPEFWEFVHSANRGLRVGTTEFVDAWMRLATKPAQTLRSSPDARDLLKEREWRVKRHLARLSNKKALDRARDEAGTGQLDFRWRQARRIISDVAQGLAA